MNKDDPASVLNISEHSNVLLILLLVVVMFAVGFFFTCVYQKKDKIKRLAQNRMGGQRQEEQVQRELSSYAHVERSTENE